MRGRPNVRISRNELKRFAGAIRRDRERLLKEWRDAVRLLPSAKGLDLPSLNDHIPALLDELADALLEGHTHSILTVSLVDKSPQVHGVQRLRAGFDISEVVAEYNILREILNGVAAREGIEMSADASRILNRVVDRAISVAVDTYVKEKTLQIQQRREEYLSFVMHDLRPPLSAIHGAHRILESCIPADAKTERVQRMLDLMRRNMDRMTALLNVATQAQYNAAVGAIGEVNLQRRQFEFSPIVEALVQDLRPLMGESDVRLVNAVPGDLMVYADAALLNHLVQNLLSNAMRHTEHGQIVVGAESCDDKGGVRGWVEDTGAGIPKERHERIFQKFETDPDKAGGQGLGLTIVKQIVEAHSGEIFLESEVGRGSKFIFTFPGPEIR